MKNAAKRQILVDHYLDFYMLALALLRNEEDAKDAVQDGIVATLVKWRIDNVYSYCRRAVYNQCMNMLREQRKYVLMNNLDAVVAPEGNEMAERVKRLKEDIPEYERAVVELHDEEGLSVADLAILTSMSEATIRRMLTKVHDELKKKLKEEI